MKNIAIVVGLGLLVCACADQQRPAIDAGLNSGITSSNGGGQRATGAIPNVGISGGRATVTGVPAGRGNAY